MPGRDADLFRPWPHVRQGILDPAGPMGLLPAA